MTKVFRQGDVCYEVIDKLPDNLTPSKDGIILASGSGGNPHTFKGGAFYPKTEGDFVIGYLKADKTKIFHLEHGKGNGKLKSASLPDNYYKVKRQVERTHKGMIVVSD